MTAWFYIITNFKNTVLYSGVARCLKQRIWQHKSRKYPKSFSARYNVTKLGYYEAHNSMVDAIRREKQIKGGNRAQKLKLINSINPGWVDLYD